jgi:D-serine deaminase-like pyridoxal phosphate-dependent protein
MMRDLVYVPSTCKIEDIETPALIVDLDKLERNIDRMARFSAESGVNIRPHAKTHKCPIIAHKQIDKGAIGITCAKLSEAEVMASAGIKNILIANQVVQRTKINRLASLVRLADVMVAVEDPGNIEDLDAAARAKGVTIPVVIEVDVGMNRCGSRSVEETLLLARKIAASPNLELRGLMGYEGHAVFIKDIEERRARCAEANDLLVKHKEALEDAGCEVSIVSAAGTGTYDLAGRNPGITEIEPGSYIFMDTRYGGIEGINFEQSLFVLTTVISKKGPSEAILDAGKKAVTEEFGLPRVAGAPGWELTKLAEEHGFIKATQPACELRVGDKVRLIPSHCCTTVNLHDMYYCCRGEFVEAVWDIAARGCVR